MGDERILRLEEKVAHQEHLIQTMSDILYEQQQLLERIARQYTQLAEQVRGLSASSEPGHQGQEIPPHY